MEDEIVRKFREIIEHYGDINAVEYDNLDILDKPARKTVLRHMGVDKYNYAKLMVISKDPEMIVENVKLAKQRQRFADSNRVERKSFREYARIENAVAELNKELLDVLKKHDLSKHTSMHFDNTNNNIKKQACGIVHITDAHFNELVDLGINKYDFEIASKRCRKFIRKAKQYFKVANINNVLLAMTGDILNADSRLDKILNEATNRSKAVFLAVQILQQVIFDLNKDYNVNVACVTGNEGRIHEETGWSDILVTDNYDFSIFHILKYLFKDSDGIKFIDDNNYVEQIVNVGGQNILLIHGHQITTKVEHSIQQIKGKYAAHGIIIDFVIYGHLHSCRIGNTYSRGASIVGANDYSESGLLLTSRASQNIHIIYGKNERDSINVDLQDTEGETGYDIDKELAEYNAKSKSKLNGKKVVFEIVV